MIPDGQGCYYDDDDEEFLPPKQSLRQRITAKLRTTFQGPQGPTGPMGPMGDQGECCCRVHHA
jgi:hypothetical protein